MQLKVYSHTLRTSIRTGVVPILLAESSKNLFPMLNNGKVNTLAYAEEKLACKTLELYGNDRTHRQQT